MALPRLACGLALLAAIAAAAPAGALTFKREGTGRACGGIFRVNKARIEWRTPFSTCVTRSAKLVTQSEDAAARTYVYELSRSGKACRYAFARVVTPLDETRSTGWSVTGFSTRQDLDANRLDDALSCYLTDAGGTRLALGPSADASVRLKPRPCRPPASLP